MIVYPSYVYFVRCDPGYIKIGWSANPIERLRSLRKRRDERRPIDAERKTAKLLALIPGNYALEQYLHGHFDQFRIGDTEWFFESADIIDFVNKLPYTAIPVRFGRRQATHVNANFRTAMRCAE